MWNSGFEAAFLGKRIIRSDLPMALTAEQHAAIATSYDQAAADFSLPAERRAEFARKADWFRHLAKLEAKRESAGRMPDASIQSAGETTEHQNTFGMQHVLISLWLTGAVLYLTSTFLFSSAVNLFGESDRSNHSNEQVTALPVPTQPEVRRPKPVIAPPETQAIPSSTVERPHAISPDQPSSEPPAAYEAPEPPPIALPTPTADPSEIATLRLNAAASIRSGPSLTAPIIGTAAVGAELQVTAYDADWVQFIDPNTGKTGWVHSQSVEPGAASKAAVAATTPTEELPQVEAPNRKPAKTAKKRAKDVVVSKRQLPSDRGPKANLALPADEEFLPPQRRPRVGILERRRMLREGLMSPGFLPPR
jgi:uncharacterized protein YraI